LAKKGRFSVLRPALPVQQIFAHLEQKAPQQDALFEGKPRKGPSFNLFPHLVQPVARGPALGCQIDARDALILEVWATLHEPGFFHAPHHIAYRRWRDVHTPRKLRVGQAILLVKGAQDKRLPSVQAQVLKQAVHAPVV
jgi:hypothetical protein